MSEPKSALSLKRKRFADPVDTLYFESSSANPATRRFTDFVYKRVKDPDGLIATPEPADENSRSKLRAVSAAAAVRSRPSNAYDNGVPHVKSSLAEDFPGLLHHTSLPSLAARKPSLSTSSLPLSRLSGYQHGRSTSSLTPDAAAAPPLSLLNLRKFHLSTASIRRNASSTSLHSSQISATSSRASLLDRSKFAITKHRAKDIDKGRSRTASAVVVEHFDRPASSRPANTVTPQRQKTILLPPTADGPSKPRRRPLVNEAEKRFRLQQQEILKARTLQNQSACVPDVKQTQRYDEQDQLAAELEQMALEMTSYAQAQDAYLPMPVPAATSKPLSPAPDTTAKPKLKYQPKPTPRRQPKVSIDDASPSTMEEALASGVEFHVAATGQQVPGTVPHPKGKSPMQPSARATTTTPTTTAAAAAPSPQLAAGEEASPMSIDRFLAESDSESDSEYVYDVFIRQPVQDYERELRNAQMLRDGDSAAAVPRDIGVVVITDEDAPYWEEFFEEGNEEEGKEWNSEDEDSNAEDYYANEYPEEEDSEDEERDKGGLWYDDDDDDDDNDKYDSDNIYGGFRTGIRDFSDDDDDYY